MTKVRKALHGKVRTWPSQESFIKSMVLNPGVNFSITGMSKSTWRLVRKLFMTSGA